jgi:hypothetical protein
MQCGAETERKTDGQTVASRSLPAENIAQLGQGRHLGEETFFWSDTTNVCNIVGVTSELFRSRNLTN